MVISPFQTPFLLGFEGLEEMLYRVAKGADSFPPYNVEQISAELLRMTFAVAGYKEEELEVLLKAAAVRYLNQQMVAGMIRREHTVFQHADAAELTGEYVCMEMIGKMQRDKIGENNVQDN